MAINNSYLYDVLSGLHAADVRIWGKLSGLIADVPGLSGKVSGAFGDGSYLVTSKTDGIAKSNYQITTAALSNSETKVPVEKVVKDYVDAEDEALEAKVSGAFGGDAFVTVGKADGITASTLKLGADNHTTLSAENTVATEAAVKSYVDNKTDGATLSAVTGENGISGSITGHTIALTNSLNLRKLSTATGSGYVASYALFAGDVQLGTTDNVINIPKDQFLKAAAYIPSSETIDLTFAVAGATGDQAPQTVSIPVNELVHEYVGGNGVDVAYSGAAAGQTTISAKIDADTNSYLTFTNDGKLSVLKSTIDGVMDGKDNAISSYLNGEIDAVKTALSGAGSVGARVTTLENTVSGSQTGILARLTTAEGDIDNLKAKTSGTFASDDNLVKWNGAAYADAGVQVGTTTSASFGTADKLATEVGAKAYADGAIAAAIEAADAIPKVSNAEGKVAKFKADGTLESTGATVGTDSDTITTSSTASTLATEKAVANAIKVTDDKLSGYIPLVASGNTNKVPVLTADGKLSASTVTIDTTGAFDGSDAKIPTESVISAFVDDKVSGSISGLDPNEFVLAKTANSVETTGLTKIDAITDASAAGLSANIPTAKAVVDYVEDGLNSLYGQINTFNTTQLA